MSYLKWRFDFLVRCVYVGCRELATKKNIKLHLYNSGLIPNYSIWTSHGEWTAIGVVEKNVSSSCVIYYQQLNSMNHVIFNARGFYQQEDDNT